MSSIPLIYRGTAALSELYGKANSLKRLTPLLKDCELFEVDFAEARSQSKSGTVHGMTIFSDGKSGMP